VCARLAPGCGPDDQRAGITVVGTADAAAPLAEELSAHAGVRSATARLTGPHAQLALHLRVTADDGASLVDLRRHIDEVAVPRLLGALELPALDTDVLVRLTTR
jgi:hypothetical protein